MKIRLNGKKLKGDTESIEQIKPYRKNFYRNYNNYKKIFSKKTQERMDADLANNSIVDFRKKKQDGPILSYVSLFNDGVNTKTGKSFFTLILLGEVPKNIVNHELWHLCMRPQEEDRIEYGQDKIVTFHGCERITVESKEKIDKGEAKDGDVIGYGSGLDEGMANITSILAIIKEKAAIYKNGEVIGYKKDVLALADKYMDTGEIDPKLGIIRGHYQVYEDIARLLIMVSRNDYKLEHPFSKVLESDEGIDGWIEHPVNKPYSSFIYSSVNADADFEREWNDFYEKDKEKRRSYMKLNTALDSMMEQIINGGTEALNKEEMQKISIIINLIAQFYNHKLEILSNKGDISKEKRIYLLKKFAVSANSITNKLKNMLKEKQTEER